MTASSEVRDLVSLLSSPERDYLVRNNCEKVKIESLKGKKVGIYFSASWCGPCHRFTPVLTEVYNELSPKGGFEVVFVSSDMDDESFDEYFSMMPWLAIPFSDLATRDGLDDHFSVQGIPHLVILNENGEVVSEEGVELIREYGAEAHPFSEQRIKELKEREEEERRNQSLRSLLVLSHRDYVIASDGKKVPVSKLEGKTVGLYFSLTFYPPCSEFTKKLVKVYGNLKAKGEEFEIVMIPLDDEEETFQQAFLSMPWLALPCKDKKCAKLIRYFELATLPTLAIIGPNGKTLHSNVAEVVKEHGALAYPFTPEKFAELEEIQKAKEASQNLQSILVSGDKDFVIGKGGAKIPVSSLVGKNILLYFSAHWCPHCRAFMPKLIEAYHKIKMKDDAFEVIFVSSDWDQASFDEFFAEMPWLALPFGDERKASLSRTFKVKGIPMLVALGPTGRTITKKAKELVTLHGADAYPFTVERLKEMEAEFEEMAKGWPEKVKHQLHEEHELVLTRRERYICDSCGDRGSGWSFCCIQCDFDLHPKCALEEINVDKNEGDEENNTEDKSKDDGENTPEDQSKDDGENNTKEGWICDGQVCCLSGLVLLCIVISML